MWEHFWLVTLRVETYGTRWEDQLTTGTLAEVLPTYHAARADPRVLRRTLGRVNRLDESTRPESCWCGRHYREGQSWSHSRADWWTCRGCRGHWVTTCAACERVRVWPEPVGDCQAIRRV